MMLERLTKKIKYYTFLKRTLRIYLYGILLRLYLMRLSFQSAIAERTEISTPINSWKRITEALYLENLNVDPYSGDSFHQLPINLKIYQMLVYYCKDYIQLVFVFFDAATANLLNIIVKKYFHVRKEMENENKRFCSVKLKVNLTTETDCHSVAKYVYAVYLFNPYVVLNCVALTSTVFTNFFLAMFLYGMICKNIVVSSLFLAICISQDIYFIILMAPLFVHFTISEKSREKGCMSIVLVIMFWFTLMHLSCSVYHSWDFLNSTYGFILTVPDLRPNIGVFWYLFTEIFEHFHLFFLCSLQINILFLYIVPLSIRFRNDALFLSFVLMHLTAIFKSYPCIGDVGFVLSILPYWMDIFKYTKQTFIIASWFMGITPIVPIFWYLWLYNGSANANFYFGATLSFAVIQIFLLIDILSAYVKREHLILYGTK